MLIFKSHSSPLFPIINFAEQFHLPPKPLLELVTRGVQRGPFPLDQTALSWFAKALDFRDTPAPSPQLRRHLHQLVCPRPELLRCRFAVVLKPHNHISVALYST